MNSLCSSSHVKREELVKQNLTIKASSLTLCSAVEVCETSVFFRGDTELFGLMKLTVYVRSSGSSAFYAVLIAPAC